MWHHPVDDNPVDQARKAWEEAGAAFLLDPDNPERIEDERRARARYEAALRQAGLTPLLAAGGALEAPSAPAPRKRAGG